MFPHLAKNFQINQCPSKLSALFLCYFSSISAYNLMESKDTDDVILPLDTYRIHLDVSNKTIDTKLEKNISELWRKFWLKSDRIDHWWPSRSGGIHWSTGLKYWQKRIRKFEESHGQQSQYMLQIIKCNNQSFRNIRTNYLTHFTESFLPPPLPLTSMIGNFWRRVWVIFLTHF